MSGEQGQSQEWPPLPPEWLGGGHPPPRTRITADLLERLIAGEAHPNASVEYGILRIGAPGSQVIYRIGEKEEFGRFYWCARPD